MSRLTLRLPDTLHDRLRSLASHENISLNQYVVYALTQQVTLSYAIQTTPEEAVAEQRAAYTALLQSLGRASFDEIQQVMDERETVAPEEGLSPEVAEKLRRRIQSQRRTT